MRTLLAKSFLITILSFIAISSAFAWQCRVHNARGQVWFGVGATRAIATANAMGICARNSKYARNCVVDGCKAGGPVPPLGRWVCNVGNARGETFFGRGPSRSAAAARAMGFCTQRSAYARNCVIRTCFVR